MKKPPIKIIQLGMAFSYLMIEITLLHLAKITIKDTPTVTGALNLIALFAIPVLAIATLSDTKKVVNWLTELWQEVKALRQ